MTGRPDIASGDIDPSALDVAPERPKRRRRRKRPEPAAELREWQPGARKRADARSYPPGVMLEPAGMDREHWTAPHSDVDLWMLQLADAFGTRSSAVMATFLTQLEALCERQIWDEEARQWRLDESQLNAALALVNTVRPRNELEAAQAAQMMAVHLMTMKLAARALRYDGDARTAAVAAKLARTFTLQMDALRSGRRRKPAAKQTITVRKELHQHVHYHRGEEESGRQPHGRAAALADNCAALPSPDAGGYALPLPGGEGQGTLQAARRR